jgi:hypothetical protein
MRPRILKIAVRISGMEMPIASVKIKKFADVLQPETELLCPKCKQKPKWVGGYDCSCGEHYNHWSQLLRVVKATGEPVTKTKFTSEKEDVVADAFIMDMKEFSEIADATLTEYGITVSDETSARNLKKLLIATKNLDKVVFIRYLDTYEERVAILTTSISNRIILKEIIPLNLADIEETMRIDFSNVTEKDIAEAEQFIKLLPLAKEDLLYISDYRTKGITLKTESPKVIELEAILSKAKNPKLTA